eukprot:96038_1
MTNTMNSFVSWIIAWIFSIFLLSFIIVIVIKSIVHLLFKKSLQIDHKYVFVKPIRKNRKDNQIKKQKQSISYTRHIRYITIVCLLAYLIGNISSFSNMSMIIINNNYETELRVAITFSYMGRTLMNWVFISRLKYSFINTKWSYSNITFKLFYSLLALIVIFSICILVRFVEYTDTLNRYLCILIIILDVICSVSLAILFQYKTFQLVKSYFISFQQFQMKLKEINTDKDVSLQIENVSQHTHSLVSIHSQKDVNNIEKIPKTKCANVSLFYENIISDSVVITDENYLILPPTKSHYVKAFDH